MPPPDPPSVPPGGDDPAQRLAGSAALDGTPGAGYVLRRGIPVELAARAGLRHDPDWGGRPAVLAPLFDAAGRLASVHGRYLETRRGQDKMLTVGPGGGLFAAGGDWRDDPLLIVEGVFDALSVAACGRGAVATIGRPVPWLAPALAGRTVWLGFDGNAPGDAAAAAWAAALAGATPIRLRPPGRCKDWNTALARLGIAGVRHWLDPHLGPRR